MGKKKRHFLKQRKLKGGATKAPTNPLDRVPNGFLFTIQYILTTQGITKYIQVHFTVNEKPFEIQPSISACWNLINRLYIYILFSKNVQDMCCPVQLAYTAWPWNMGIIQNSKYGLVFFIFYLFFLWPLIYFTVCKYYWTITVLNALSFLPILNIYCTYYENVTNIWTVTLVLKALECLGSPDGPRHCLTLKYALSGFPTE